MDVTETPCLPERTAPLSARSLRIVVADDDRDAVLMLMALLQDEGHVVRGAYGGSSVLPLVERVRPHAVILDLGMPGCSGYALAQHIRSSTSGRPAPVLIAATGKYKSDADALLSRAVGFDHHLVKPYDIQQLMALLAPLSTAGDASQPV